MTQEVAQVMYFSRTAFDAIVHDCMEFLKQKGFTALPVTADDTQFSDVFEKWFDWFGQLEPKVRVPKSVKRSHDLTQRELDLMTLDCALIHIQHGVKDVSYVEPLNNIRGTIFEVLDVMNYDFRKLPRPRYHWGCYKQWEEVARADGRAQEWIADIRLYCKNEQPEFYEE
jgi:hypothetical protein